MPKEIESSEFKDWDFKFSREDDIEKILNITRPIEFLCFFAFFYWKRLKITLIQVVSMKVALNPIWIKGEKRRLTCKNCILNSERRRANPI